MMTDEEFDTLQKKWRDRIHDIREANGTELVVSEDEYGEIQRLDAEWTHRDQMRHIENGWDVKLPLYVTLRDISLFYGINLLVEGGQPGSQQDEAIRRFGIDRRAYVEMVQVLLRSGPLDTADDIAWEILRWLANGGYEIRKRNS